MTVIDIARMPDPADFCSMLEFPAPAVSSSPDVNILVKDAILKMVEGDDLTTRVEFDDLYRRSLIEQGKRTVFWEEACEDEDFAPLVLCLSTNGGVKAKAEEIKSDVVENQDTEMTEAPKSEEEYAKEAEEKQNKAQEEQIKRLKDEKSRRLAFWQQAFLRFKSKGWYILHLPLISRIYNIDEDSDEYVIITRDLLLPIVQDIISMETEGGVGLDEICFKIRGYGRFRCVGKEAVRECGMLVVGLLGTSSGVDGSECCL
jgi:hypothetical protein